MGNNAWVLPPRGRLETFNLDRAAADQPQGLTWDKLYWESLQG